MLIIIIMTLYASHDICMHCSICIRANQYGATYFLVEHEQLSESNSVFASDSAV